MKNYSHVLPLTILLVLCCSCSTLNNFGEISTISVKQFEDNLFVSNKRISDKKFEYVKDGKESCFKDNPLNQVTYTVRALELENAVYLLNVKNENWDYVLTKENNKHFNATPLHSQINYEYAICEVKFLGFTYNYAYEGTNSYISFRYISGDKK